MVAKSGDVPLTEPAVEAIRRSLLPLAAVLTPNRPEAERLLGLSVSNRDEARDAARRLVDLGPRAVVVKGGHFDEADIVDLLYDGSTFHEFRHPRLQHASHARHGLHLRRGDRGAARARPDTSGCRAARDRYVEGAIAHGLAIGSGQGPLDHFWAVRPAE